MIELKKFKQFAFLKKDFDKYEDNSLPYEDEEPSELTEGLLNLVKKS
jgi:hypothetical protein